MNLKKMSLGKILGYVCMIWMIIALSMCHDKNEPKEFGAGEHQCAYCMMGISDMRFRSEAVTKKGKFYYFDAIECLGNWSAEHGSEIHESWVADFSKNGKWIKASEAHYLHSKKLNSPMGAGLSAYSNNEALERSREIFGGESISYTSLPEFIQKKKDMHNKH